MLDRLASRHFAPLIGQTHPLILADGHALPIRVDSVSDQPKAQPPDAPADSRMPFTVTLTALEPTAFICGPCTLDLPEVGRVEGIWVDRMASLGRDPTGHYFQILFN